MTHPHKLLLLANWLICPTRTYTKRKENIAPTNEKKQNKSTDNWQNITLDEQNSNET
jgi:hypothetical protein